MSVHDAELSDIYVDKDGKLWRCTMTFGEPTVGFEAVEGRTLPSSNNQIASGLAQNIYYGPSAPPIVREKRSGGVNSLMWDGWKRIWRKETPAADN